MASKRHIGMSCCIAECIPQQWRHRFIATWIGGLVPGGLFVISLYLRASEGLSDRNKEPLSFAASFIQGLQGPWICGGDWNLSPAALLDARWPQQVCGSIAAPAAPTCTHLTDTVHDYFVVCAGLMPAVAAVHWPARNSRLSSHAIQHPVPEGASGG